MRMAAASASTSFAIGTMPVVLDRSPGGERDQARGRDHFLSKLVVQEHGLRC
jgi:hypothetical protein